MKPFIKKLARSAQVLFPHLVDMKFAVHRWYYETTGTVFKPELNGLRHFSWDGKLVLDVGANRGQFVTAVKNVFPKSRIMSFEPNPVLARQIARRYADDPKVRVECCALSHTAGVLPLYIPSYRGYLFDGLASTVRDEADTWFNLGRFYCFDPAKSSIDVITVPTRQLDSYDLAPALIKLHAQRSEIQILKGARQTILKHRPVIVAAWTWVEEVEILIAYGYEPFAYSDGGFHADRQGDEFTWFLLPEHIAQINENSIKRA